MNRSLLICSKGRLSIKKEKKIPLLTFMPGSGIFFMKRHRPQGIKDFCLQKRFFASSTKDEEKSSKEKGRSTRRGKAHLRHNRKKNKMRADQFWPALLFYFDLKTKNKLIRRLADIKSRILRDAV